MMASQLGAAVNKVVRMFSNKSKKEWFTDHNRDQFVRQSRKDNYRSRAAYKLLEVDERYKLFKEEDRVLDLGSAPGGWSQALIAKHPSCKVVAIDLLKMDPIPNIKFYQGDATDSTLMNIILEKNGKFNVIISDMAPNFTGTGFETHEQIVSLNKMCMSLCSVALADGGNLLMKTLQGEGERSLFTTLEMFFGEAVRIKPKASKSCSSEMFVLGRNFKAESRELIKSARSVEFASSDTKSTLLEKFRVAHSRNI